MPQMLCTNSTWISKRPNMLGVTPSSLFSDFQVNHFVFTPGTTIQYVVPIQPNRFTLHFWTNTLNTYIVGPSPKITGQTGIAVPNGNNFAPITFPVHGPMVGLGWYCQAFAAGGNGGFTEIIYAPRVDESCAAKTSKSELTRSLLSRTRKLPQPLRQFAAHRLADNSLQLVETPQGHYMLPRISTVQPQLDSTLHRVDSHSL